MDHLTRSLGVLSYSLGGGLGALGDDADTPHWLKVFDVTIGWVYFVAWSSSFYGQVYENYKNKK